jgi:hypothetical protein
MDELVAFKTKSNPLKVPLKVKLLIFPFITMLPNPQERL